MIVDEAQNLEKMVLLTALTRLGEGSRVVLTHDVAQRDNLHVGRYDGVASVVSTLAGNELFGHVSLTALRAQSGGGPGDGPAQLTDCLS